MTHEELCRMEQSKLVKLIDEGKLVLSSEVEQLKAENAELKSRLEKAVDDECKNVKLIADLFNLCNVEMEKRDNVFKRLHISAGDYMGSGYAFIDAFNKIWDSFCENTNDEMYYKIIRQAKKALKEREINGK